MGLIIKNEIQKLMVGYPTVSDKYDVGAGMLEGTVNAKNGDVLKYGSASGAYEVASNITSADQVAGVLLATNVKTPNTYPAAIGSVETLVGESFNLCVRGFIAVELDSAAVLADAKEGSPVYITSTGKLTTVASSNVKLPWKFMGITETHGTAKVAEIVL